jgi:Arc/MetJ-type ribon-helix-helix transcriptional regulator
MPIVMDAAMTIPMDVQQRVSALLGTGRYSSEEEVLRAAVAALEIQDADVTAIQAGIRDLEQGRYRPFSEFKSDFRKHNQLENDG